MTVKLETNVVYMLLHWFPLKCFALPIKVRVDNITYSLYYNLLTIPTIFQ